MKLSHLHEAVDSAALIKEVAAELGWKIDLEQTSPATVAAAIDLVRLHLDTEGSAQIRARLQEIERLATDTKPLPDGMEGLEYLEDTTFGMLPDVKAFYEASKQVMKTARATRWAASQCIQIYFVLANLNHTALTKMSSEHTDDEVKYRASIARAAMKQLGLTPKEM